MYKHFTKQDWEKALGLEGCTLDYFITTGSGKRENETETFKKVLSEYSLDKPLENLKDSFFKKLFSRWFYAFFSWDYGMIRIALACTIRGAWLRVFFFALLPVLPPVAGLSGTQVTEKPASTEISWLVT